MHRHPRIRVVPQRLRRAAAPGLAGAIALTFALGLGGGANADEPPERPVSLAERCAALPAPTPARDRHVEMEVVREDRVTGSASFHAEALPDPDDPAGRMLWRVREHLTFGEGEDAWHEEHEAWLLPSLAPVRGTRREGEGEEAVIWSWRAMPDTFRIEVTSAVREARTKEAAAVANPFVTTTAALLLLATVPDAELRLSARTFDPTWEYLEAGRPFSGAEIVLDTSGGSRRLTLRSDDLSRLEIRLDEDGEAPVAMRIHVEGHGEISLRPKREAPAEETWSPALLDAPARTAKAAALRTAFAFMTADPERFAEVIHWPTLRANSADVVTGEVTADAFRAAILQQFVEKAPAATPKTIAVGYLGSIEGDFQVEATDADHAIVTLPAVFGAMRLTVERIEGLWYLVRLPGR